MSAACDCPLTRSGAHLDGCIYGRSPARAHAQAPCRFSVVVDYGLSERESQAAVLLGRGATNGEIARGLSVNLPAARKLMGRIMLKTRATNRTMAALRLAGLLKA